MPPRPNRHVEHSDSILFVPQDSLLPEVLLMKTISKPSQTMHHASLLRLLTCAFAALLCFTFIAAESQAQSKVKTTIKVEPLSLTGAQKRVLASGGVHIEIKKSGGANIGTVIGLVKAPVSEIAPIVADCGKYSDWRDSLLNTSVVKKESASVLVCKGTAKVPFPASNRNGHFRVENKNETVADVASFTSVYGYIEGTGNLEDMFGYWLLQPFDGNPEYTVIKHILSVDIGGWLPDFLVRWATSRVLPDTIYGVRMRHAQLHKIKGLKKPTYW